MILLKKQLVFFFLSKDLDLLIKENPSSLSEDHRWFSFDTGYFPVHYGLFLIIVEG